MGILDQLLAQLTNPSVLQMPGNAAPIDAGLLNIPGIGGLPPNVAVPPDPFGAPPQPDVQVQQPNNDPWKGGIAPPMGMLGMPTMPSNQPGADLPPSTNDPISREPQVFADGVPLPRPRPLDATGNPAPEQQDDSQASIPDAAKPTQASGQDSSGGLPDFLTKGIFDPGNAGTLLALGAGFSGAPSFGTGMRRAFTAAGPAIEARQQLQIKQGTIASTYRALVAKGVPPQEALAASMNPEIMKATAAKYFETKPPVPSKIGVDAFGNDIMGSFDPTTKKFYDVAGKEIGSNPDGSAASAPGVFGGVLAKGVREYNSDLPAAEYKDQFSPEVQAAMDDYISGNTMPTANPRLKGFSSKVSEWAKTYGNKAGVEVSDAAFSGKRKLRTDLASSSPNSMGGILSNGKSAFAHLANASDEMVSIGNRNGPDIPGGGHIAGAENYIGNVLLPTSETNAKKTAIADNLGKYGAEATKFYAGTGGSAEERLHGLKDNNPSTQSGNEQAAFLRVEKGLMLERLAQKEAQVREQLGDKYIQDHPIRTPDLTNAISRIDANIAKLQAGPGATPAGIGQPVLGPGQSTTINGVVIRRVN